MMSLFECGWCMRKGEGGCTLDTHDDSSAPSVCPYGHEDVEWAVKRFGK